MKSLSLTTPHVLFIIGMPGVGKTYFATKFSETFGAPFVEADRLRSAVTAEPSFDTDEQTVVNQLVHIQMTELLKTKKTFIVETTAEAKVDRHTLAKLARAHDYEPLFIWVQTDPETAYRRATKPSRINKDKTLILPEDRYDHLVKRFTQPAASENVTVISGKHTYASQARVVLKRLAEPNRPAATTALKVPPRQAPKGNSIKVA